jgi:hypothetical protein
MKRVLVVLAIAVLVLLAIGGVVFSLQNNKVTEVTEMTGLIEPATIDFPARLQGIKVEPHFKLDGMKTTVTLRIKNSGTSPCEYRLLEFKLAGQTPREAVLPVEVARLDAGQTKEIEMTFDNVPWEWTEWDARVNVSHKSASRTLPPNGAAPDQKLEASSAGERSASNPFRLPDKEFKRVLPIFKEKYPRIGHSLSHDATASLEGDLTTVAVTFSNQGDYPLVDFELSNPTLGGNGKPSGLNDATGSASSSEIKPGGSKTYKLSYKKVRWDFSKSDSPVLNMQLQYSFRRPDSIAFKGNTFQLEKIDGRFESKAFVGVSVKKPTKPSDAAKKL